MKTEIPTINVSPRFSLRLAPTLVVAAVFILSVAAQLAYAAPGDLFESDYSSNQIYEFTPGGTRSTFASGLNGPHGLAFDSAGNLFEADFGNIYEFTPGGTRSTFASGLDIPYGLAFNSAGNLFEADYASGNIYEFTPGGTRSTFASGLNGPQGLAFDSAGNLFVADQVSGNIYKFTPDGTRSTFASGLNVPSGLAFNSAGNLFEGDIGSGNIYEFTPGGTRSTFASGLGDPWGLAFNSAGNLFAADYGSGNIYEFTPGGARSTFASGLAGPTFLAFYPPAAAAPVITSANNTTFTVGSNGSFTVTATGIPTPTLSESGALPSGVTFNTATGVLSGTPAAGTAGVYPITFTATNGVPPDAIQSFTLTVSTVTQAPVIISPSNTTFTVGNNGGFTVTTTGIPTPTLSESGALPSGVTFNAATGVLSGTPAAGTVGVYPITFTASNGVPPDAMQSFTLAVTVNQAPVITSPSTATATQNQLFVYQIFATGTPTSYSAAPLPAGLTFDSGSGIIGGIPTDPGTTPIQLTASNSSGTGMKTLTLTVQAVPSSGPVITSGTSITARTGQPFNFQVSTTGGSATARLRASGLPAGLSYDPVTGVISGTPTAAGSFGVTLTVTDRSVTTTSTLQLTLTSDPAFPVITSPRAAVLVAGQPFFYRIVASSSDRSHPITFSLFGPLPLGLSFDPATGIISGTYNPGFFANGSPLLNGGPVNPNGTGAHNPTGTGASTLNYTTPAPGAAKNISTRGVVQTGANVMIGGFIVTGNAPKKVLVRAIGPELTAFGVPGAMQNPTLELHDAHSIIAQNDDWQSTVMRGMITSNQVAEIQHSQHKPTNPAESAIIATLQPGSYTAIVRGKNNTTGVALVEVYDLGIACFDTSCNAQVANFSTRGMVQTGYGILDGGFIVQGDMPANVIVRAIGPSLAQHGITNPLQDPTLELLDHTGARIAYNDNWTNASNKQAIISSGQAPKNNLESAILMSLSPGNYTAIVRGKNGATGIALVEAYVLQ